MERLKSAFISNISHEIRTPLNAVLSLSQFMRDGSAGALTAEQTRYLDVIQRSGQSVLNLLSDIIDLANLETKNLETRSEEIAPGVIAQAVAGAAAAAGAQQEAERAWSTCPRRCRTCAPTAIGSVR